MRGLLVLLLPALVVSTSSRFWQLRRTNPAKAVTVIAAPSVAVATSNPLLESVELPRFADVRPEHLKPAVVSRLADGEDRLKLMETSLSEKLAATKDVIPYETVMLPLEQLYDHVDQPWSLMNHLKSVRDSAPLRDAIQELQPKVVGFWQKISQSKPIYDALVRLNTTSFAALPEARQRIVEKELNDRKLGGVGLAGDEAKQFNKVQQQLSELSTTFSNHVMDATAAWNTTLTDKQAVEGIPSRTLTSMAENSKKAGNKDATAEKGPWLLTLDPTIGGPVMQYCDARATREQYFRASITLASLGKNNNMGTISEMLSLRQRQAHLLGFPNYAELSLASKMATLPEVHAFLGELQTKARPSAVQDDTELRAFAKKLGGPEDLKPWDRSYYSEKLRKERYDVDSEALRVYFAYPTVLEGLFAMTSRLFDAHIEPADDLAPKVRWHEDVRLFTVKKGNSSEVSGYLMLDVYSRPGEKRAGAWVQPMSPRRMGEDGELKDPVAAVILNLPHPQEGKPALLSLNEVDTLFHEFGHALQHVLTVQTESPVSGINGVEWDAVEVASQFMEYWVNFDKRTFYSFAKHYETGEPLPEATYERLRKAASFHAGTGIISQVYLGSVDMRLHEEYKEGEDVNAIEKGIAKEILVNEPLPEARNLCSFSHIFSGGYSAGYYSYQWSKVLSADAFNAFDEAGLENEEKQKALGHKYASTILALGGGRPPAKVFADFRGRAPKVDALLKYSGLSEVH